MAKDFRHGVHSNKSQFQRRSQQKTDTVDQGGSSSAKIWALVFGFTTVLLVGYILFEHFVLKAKDAEQATEKSILIAAQELTEKAQDSVTNLTERLEPEPVVVEEVEVKQDELLVDTQERTRFSFYEGLAKTEVVVDAIPIPIQLEQPYYIQAGTFSSEAVAQKEQARLKKLGQDLDLSIYYGTKRIYFRLRVGPFSDRLKLNKKRNELRRLGLDTLLIKAPKSKPPQG